MTRHPAGVLAAVGRSVARTGVLLAGGRLAMPRTNLGRPIAFADGTTSRVFRETVRRGETGQPALLVVRFRLAAIGRRRWAHAVFRTTCLANTPLFAGFPGFRSKLWLTDPGTGVYRGVYEWDGPSAAVDYAENLREVLRLVCVPGSIDYHVVGGVRRDAAVAGTAPLGPSAGGDDGWWRPAAGEVRADHTSFGRDWQ